MVTQKFKQKDEFLEEDVEKEIVKVTDKQVIMTYYFENGSKDEKTESFDSFVRCDDREDVIEFMEINKRYEKY